MDKITKLLRGPTPEEVVRKWSSEIRSQNRQIDREIRAIISEENKVKINLKQVAKRSDRSLLTCKMLAQELVRSRKHKNRLATSKAMLNSIDMQLKEQMATLKITGTLQKSTEVMKLVNGAVRLPEINQIMQRMSMEMTKAGIIDEMISDSFDVLGEDDELDQEADEEVNKVLFEITDGALGTPSAVKPLPSAHLEVEEEEEEELEAMQARLEALKS